MKIFSPLHKHGLPVVAVLASVTAALLGFGQPSATTAHAEPQPASETPTAAAQRAPKGLTLVPLPPDEEEGSPGQSISGEVLEQIDVEKYSYLRLGKKGSPGTWAAVPAAPSQLGKRVTVSHAEVMTQFASATLKRTFEAIYFGLLDAPEASSPGAVVGPRGEPSPASTPAAADYAGMQPHPGAGPSANRVAVGQVKRASGPLARTVVELNAARPEAAGGKARVRAVVVKSTSGVMGRTFLHVRDGSGEASAGTNDLAVTTTADAAVGAELVLEGTIEIDKDFGSGYRYRVLLADAMLVAD